MHSINWLSLLLNSLRLLVYMYKRVLVSRSNLRCIMLITNHQLSAITSCNLFSSHYRCQSLFRYFSFIRACSSNWSAYCALLIRLMIKSLTYTQLFSSHIQSSSYENLVCDAKRYVTNRQNDWIGTSLLIAH